VETLGRKQRTPRGVPGVLVVRLLTICGLGCRGIGNRKCRNRNGRSLSRDRGRRPSLTNGNLNSSAVILHCTLVYSRLRADPFVTGRSPLQFSINVGSSASAFELLRISGCSVSATFARSDGRIYLQPNVGLGRID
jgi:hypothetical protein